MSEVGIEIYEWNNNLRTLQKLSASIFTANSKGKDTARVKMSLIKTEINDRLRTIYQGINIDIKVRILADFRKV